MVQEVHLFFSHNCLPDVFSVNLLCDCCVHKVTHFIYMVPTWRQQLLSDGRRSVCSVSSHQGQHFTALV